MESPGQVSPDGNWRWDGRQWVRNTSAPTPGPATIVPAAPRSADAMTQQQPMQSPGQVSPDGNWRWDGQQWVPQAGPAYVVAASPGPMVVAPKSPAVSLIVSFFIPGVGSMLNGDVGKGVAFLIVFLVGVGASFFLIGLPVALGAWIWGMIDAYQGAQRWNALHGILS